ncbi:HTH-type transcriptional regulator MhqR [Poriferisphaera corsica]|uniref:HTH-type transcriptional regulator MhqR n=1 Tax=Poriferisphaera corsica TaxID=2528020 RepID=A0A517YX20_9BACT|nr:MarR family transcriptional regulator [Poriferisphaera corsica]QDU34762.1 HTH-type transcriptional regulator MhqR [Poriferisphaera corsica]
MTTQTVVPQDKTRTKLISAIAEQYPSANTELIETQLALMDFAHLTILGAESHFSQFGLSQGRFAIMVLLFLLSNEQWTPARIAQTVSSSRATVTGLLKNLQDQQMIERESNPSDGRSSFIKLSRKGRKLIAKILPTHFKQVDPLFDALTKKERIQLLKLLAKITPTIQNR